MSRKLHYTKSGNLDMRYNSSKAAVSSGRSFSTGSSSSSGLTYKKDGTLDMRYASSKAVLGQGCSAGSNNSSSSGLTYKKDGTLDMRYASSKAVASGAIVLKKDGTPDMRYKSSHGLTQVANKLRGMKLQNIPMHVPLTKSGIPDMRTKAGKEWVQSEARSSSREIPDWIPRKKDGRPDTSKAIVAEYFSYSTGSSMLNHLPDQEHLFRAKYYSEKMTDPHFQELVQVAQLDCFEMPTMSTLTDTHILKRELSQVVQNSDFTQGIIGLPNSIPLLDYDQLKTSFGDEENAQVGKGSFGIVLKGKWNGNDIAVKRLHLSELTKKETPGFIREIKIMALLCNHPNLVTLHGYVLKPPCFVMEFVKLGSLNYILHYCEDDQIEAQFTNGRTKKKIILGIVNGMRQLHAVGVIHGDLKPCNVLVAQDYTAKITDFGFSTLRGKTSSSLVSINDGENIIAGTGAYMAPEMLTHSKPPEFFTDVYSFGILLNEVIQEEEPYSGEYLNFQGRGIFAAADYARKGNRPFIGSKTPQSLQNIIKKCWNSTPEARPTFDGLFGELNTCEFPNSISLLET